MKGPYGWLFDPNRCIECRACEAACKQWNGVPTGVNIRYRRVSTREFGAWPAVSVVAISSACNHCENPLCARACPVKAISRRSDGLVLVDRDRCVGCGICYEFCPYGAPQYDPKTRRMEKCTMCVDRIDQGLQPACADACPTGALSWGDWEDIRGRGTASIAGYPVPYSTRPRIRFVTTPARP